MPWGTRYHVEEFSKILPVTLILDRHKYALRTQALDLTLQEDAVLRALVIVSPGVCMCFTYYI